MDPPVPLAHPPSAAFSTFLPFLRSLVLPVLSRIKTQSCSAEVKVSSVGVPFAYLLHTPFRPNPQFQRPFVSSSLISLVSRNGLYLSPRPRHLFLRPRLFSLSLSTAFSFFFGISGSLPTLPSFFRLRQNRL